MPKWNECLTDEGVVFVKNKEEVKKLEYFETEVVKVKKEKQKYFTTQKIDGKLYGFYYNKKYKMDVRIEEIKKKPKGNWVNGENLDRIKFPFFCRYENNRLGMITSGTPTYGNYEYILHNIDSQSGCSALTRSGSLGGLIKKYNIHILKGKITIYEEE